jgi:hypothetical protein
MWTIIVLVILASGVVCGLSLFVGGSRHAPTWEEGDEHETGMYASHYLPWPPRDREAE